MTAKRIILITGGQSSGKSLYAEQRALELSTSPIYVATARAEGMEERIGRHHARRGPGWTTVEEPLGLGGLDFTGRVVLVDCVTLWLTNLLFRPDSDDGSGSNDSYGSVPRTDIESVRLTAETQLEAFTSPSATYIFVTNEVGLGGVSADALARNFADLQGRINQFIAARADEVVLVVSGIPVKIK